MEECQATPEEIMCERESNKDQLVFNQILQFYGNKHKIK